MLQKLIEPFKSKHPKMSGDIKLVLQQNVALQPNSHLNQLTIQTQQASTYTWYRNDQKINIQLSDKQKQSHYSFQLKDVGFTIKCIVQNTAGQSIVSVGPIIVDMKTQISLRNILNNNGTKFPITVTNIRVFQNDRIAAEMKNLNSISTLQISDENIRLTVQDHSCLVKHNMNGPLFKLVEDQLHLEFNQIDLMSFEELERFITKLIGYKLQGEDKIDVQFTVSSDKQKDLIELSLKYFAAKQIAFNHKFVQQSADLNNSDFNSARDLLIVIGNQQQELNQLTEIIKNQEKEKMSYINQLNQMECELELTISSYQQLMSENNMINENFNSSMPFNKSIGKSSGVFKKQMDVYQNEVKNLREEIKLLKSIQDVQINSNYYSFNREQLLKQICDMELNWQKAKRLNELLNKELIQFQQQKQGEDQIQQMQQRIMELEYSNQLVEEYHQQILDQQKQIDMMNQKIVNLQNGNSQNYQLEDYVKQLEDEIESLRNQENQENQENQSICQSFNMDQEMAYERLLSEKQSLTEQCSLLKRKNDSLQKEIDLLIRNPKQLLNVQGQYPVIESQKQALKLKSQVQQLENENNNLREELSVKSKSNITSSRYSNSKTDMSRQSTSPARRTASRSYHGIFDDLPPQPQIKRLTNSKGKQHNYSVIQ